MNFSERIGSWIHLFNRILYLYLIAILILSVVKKGWVFGILGKIGMTSDDLSLTSLQVVIGILVANMTWFKSKKIEYKTTLYSEVVDQIQSASYSLGGFKPWVKLDPKPYLIINESNQSFYDIKKLFEEFNTHSQTIHNSVINILKILEKYEMLFRPNKLTFNCLLNQSHELRKSGDKICNLLLSGYPTIKQETDGFWTSFQNYLDVYNEHINNISTHISDLRIKLMNTTFSKVFNVWVPNRVPQDKKYQPLKDDYFTKGSFLGNQYDWVSRFLWWL